jgi:hypothetical protein
MAFILSRKMSILNIKMVCNKETYTIVLNFKEDAATLENQTADYLCYLINEQPTSGIEPAIRKKSFQHLVCLFKVITADYREMNI